MSHLAGDFLKFDYKYGNESEENINFTDVWRVPDDQSTSKHFTKSDGPFVYQISFSSFLEFLDFNRAQILCIKHSWATLSADILHTSLTS